MSSREGEEKQFLSFFKQKSEIPLKVSQTLLHMCFIIQKKSIYFFCVEVKWLWLLIIFPPIHLNLMHIKGAVMHLGLMLTVFLSLCPQIRFIGGLVEPKEKIQDSSCLNLLWFKCGKYERPWRCTVLLHYLFAAGTKAVVNLMPFFHC